MTSENANIEILRDIHIDEMVDMLVEKVKDKKEVLYDEKYITEELLKTFYVEKAEKFFIDSKLINDHHHLNKFLSEINEKIGPEKMFIGFVQTLNDWRKTKKILKIPVLGMSYRMYTFVIHRVIPRLSIYSKIGFKKKYHFISKAETIGRLIYNGFEILAFTELNDKHVFIVKSIGKPLKTKPSFGPVFKMNRIAKNGKKIGVYKLRTMHPYSEFVHDYMIKNHGFGPDGKIKNDFRTSRWGKMLRKYWIDELPQIINLLKFEMKLVGVRPVSESYFNQLPKKLRESRIKYKPGCIPPYVALDFGNRKEDVLRAEEQYLKEKVNNPKSTDIKYFFIAIFKIIFQSKRSA